MKRLCILIFFFSIFNVKNSLGQKLAGQPYQDSAACLIRFTEGKTTSYKIPMTKYCFVKEAGIKQDWPGAWLMKWDVVKKANSSLLFMEMNSTDVQGWLGNGDVSGSVQLVFQLPAFKDSIVLQNLAYHKKGLSIINNYGGESKKKYLNGNISVSKKQNDFFVSCSINLFTEKPNTKQQFILSNYSVLSLSFNQFQDLENKMDSIADAEQNLFVEALTSAIISRDSVDEITNRTLKDSLKLHPYKGKFRFWISDLDKAGYSRKTYCITSDSIVVKEGPYDFIYLAKNYPRDSVYYRKALNQVEKEIVSRIEKRIGQDSLKESYNNFCIIDGLILSFSFESAVFSKDVTVSNYYNETIAFVVNLVNRISPKKYKLWYDKAILLTDQKNCNR